MPWGKYLYIDDVAMKLIAGVKDESVINELVQLNGATTGQTNETMIKGWGHAVGSNVIVTTDWCKLLVEVKSTHRKIESSFYILKAHHQLNSQKIKFISSIIDYSDYSSISGIPSWAVIIWTDSF